MPAIKFIAGSFQKSGGEKREKWEEAKSIVQEAARILDKGGRFAQVNLLLEKITEPNKHVGATFTEEEKSDRSLKYWEWVGGQLMYPHLGINAMICQALSV